MKRAILFLLLLLPGSVFGQSYTNQFPHRLKTKYFDFYFKRNEGQVAEIARFADGFIGTVNRDFFRADFQYPIRALVLEDRVRFQTFLRQEFRISIPPQYGIYLPQFRLFATYESSGLGTFAHEVLHPLVEANLSERPIWAMEGIPTFFEKFFGYWDGDQLVVYWGYQNPWRIELLGEDLKRLDLKSLLSTRDYQGSYRESDFRVVSMFLWDHGKFQKFLQLIHQGRKNGFPTYLEAAFDLPLEKVIPLWQPYLDTVYSRREQIRGIPPSAILKDRPAFEAFMKQHGLEFQPGEGRRH